MKRVYPPATVDPEASERVEKILLNDKITSDDVVGMLYTSKGVRAGDVSKPKTAKTAKSPTGRSDSLRNNTASNSNDIQDLQGLFALVLFLDVPSSPANPVRMKLQNRALEVLCAFYHRSRSNRALLANTSVILQKTQSVAQVPVLVCKGVEKGQEKSRVAAAHLLRYFIRDTKIRMLVSEMLWRKDAKSKAHESVNALMALMRGTNQSAQEDAVRLVVTLADTQDKIIVLGKKPKMMESLVAIISSGTLKSQELALGLMWRMTQNEACSSLLGCVEKCIEKLLDVLGLSPPEGEEPQEEGEIHPAELWGVRQENVFATLANLAFNPVHTDLVGKHDGVLSATFTAMCFGTERSKDYAALLIANIAYKQELCDMLSSLVLPLEELVSELLKGSDRGREYAAMAVANLSRKGTIASGLINVEGAQQVLMAARSGGTCERARRCAEKALANLGRSRVYEKQWLEVPDSVPSSAKPEKDVSRESTSFHPSDPLSPNVKASSSRSLSRQATLSKSVDMGALLILPKIWSHTQAEVTSNFPSLADGARKRPFGAFYNTAPLPNLLRVRSDRSLAGKRSPSFKPNRTSPVSGSPTDNQLLKREGSHRKIEPLIRSSTNPHLKKQPSLRRQDSGASKPQERSLLEQAAHTKEGTGAHTIDLFSDPASQG